MRHFPFFLLFQLLHFGHILEVNFVLCVVLILELYKGMERITEKCFYFLSFLV